MRGPVPESLFSCRFSTTRGSCFFLAVVDLDTGLLLHALLEHDVRPEPAATADPVLLPITPYSTATWATPDDIKT